MKSIAFIGVENYQSHAMTSVRPAPGGELTVLVGPTDSGKSGLLRGLRWLYYGGTPSIRVGQRDVSVSVTLADGTEVIRERRGRTNSYTVVHPDGDVQVYESFGTDIPMEVQQALGVRPIEIGDLTIEANMARQHDPAFLVSGVSAPARARVIGQLAGVEAVDWATRDANSDIHAGRREMNQLADAIERLESEVEQYAHLERMGAVLEKLEDDVKELENLSLRRDTLSAHHSKLKTLREQKTRLQDVLAATADASKALDSVVQAQDLVLLSKTVRSLSAKAYGLEWNITSFRSTIRSTKGAGEALGLLMDAQERRGLRAKLASTRDVLAMISDERTRLSHKAANSPPFALVAGAIQDAEQALRRKEALNNASLDLKTLANLRRDTLSHIQESQQSYTQATQQYDELLIEAGVCPTCGSDTHTKHKEAV